MKTLVAIVVTGLAAGSAGAGQDRIAIDYVGYRDALRMPMRSTSRIGMRRGRYARGIRWSVCGAYSRLEGAQQSAVAKAVAEVDNPLLTARHQGETRDKLLYSSRATRK